MSPVTGPRHADQRHCHEPAAAGQGGGGLPHTGGGHDGGEGEQEGGIQESGAQGGA